jgi:DNA sulfur modification protein DndD
MRISRIKIQNFRQHRNVDLDLSSEQCDFVVIKGSMGAGKTNLLRAVTWAIYGELDSHTERSKPYLLSDSAVVELKEGEYADTEVMVGLELGNAATARITRKQSFKKVGADVVPFGDPSLVVQTTKDIKQGFAVEADSQIWVEKHLPRRFRPYFLFDGERLEKFLTDSDAPKIRAAIQEVARIDVLNRIQEKLQRASDLLGRKIGKAVVNGAKLEEEFVQVTEGITKKEAEINEIEQKYADAQDAEQLLDKRLAGLKNIEENIEKKRKIDAQVDAAERWLREKRAEFNLRVRGAAAGALLAPAVKVLGIQIDEAKKKGILPPPVDLGYLQQLLNAGQCICGTDLVASAGHAAHIQKVIDDYQRVSEVGSALNEHATTHVAVLARLVGQADTINILNRSISEREEEIRALLEQQEQLAKDLEGQDDEVIRRLALERREQQRLREKYAVDLAGARDEIKRLTAEKLRIAKEIDVAAEANEQAKVARKNKDFANAAAKVAKELYEKMNTEVRLGVARSLEARFRAMTWKKDFFTSIGIDQDFRVSVVNNQGIEMYQRLSAGETVCMAFAFSLTLSKEAGLNFPMVVDTPMGRLAPEVQVNLSEVIVDATRATKSNPSHQIILLMTETEYNEKVASVFQKRRPKVFEIQFDVKTSETKVL